MTKLELTLKLPEQLAQETQAAGLLAAEEIQAEIDAYRAELRPAPAS